MDDDVVDIEIDLDHLDAIPVAESKTGERFLVNRLKLIKENNFHFLFSLIQLNLSFNEIEFIENSSFKNLNKLKSLDLNYNRFISIQNEFFHFFHSKNFLAFFLLERPPG